MTIPILATSPDLDPNLNTTLSRIQILYALKSLRRATGVCRFTAIGISSSATTSLPSISVLS